MLAQTEHHQFSLDVSPIKKQCIGTPMLALSPFMTANDFDASNALMLLAIDTSSATHLHFLVPNYDFDDSIYFNYGFYCSHLYFDSGYYILCLLLKTVSMMEP
jgi:hypothetical protein